MKTQLKLQSVRTGGYVVKLAILKCLLVTALCIGANAQQGRPPAHPTTGVAQKSGAEGVFARAASKVVFLITRKSGEIHASASGVILAADGYIATNFHALQGADAVEIRYFPDPAKSEDYQSFNAAKLLYSDPERDIAVLKVSSNSLPFLECPAKTGCEPRVGEAIYAIGNPKGLSNTISEGIVSALRFIDRENVIQHTAAISPGSSDGALVDSSGNLLGMNSWQVADAQNLNFAISAKHLLKALDAARRTTTALSFPPDASAEMTGITEDRNQPNQRAMAALRTIVDSIKSCPRFTQFMDEKDSKKEGPLTRVRFYAGPAMNVIWDVTRSDSFRAPYQAYVEFSIPSEYSIPPDIWDKWAIKASDLYAVIDVPQPLWKYRYEFDLGPDGLQLTRSLMRTDKETEWKDSPPGRYCWQTAAQVGQIGPSKTKR